ncbi:MAG: hypothetical protein ACTSUE_11380 [Promethearchaeota archaeon]
MEYTRWLFGFAEIDLYRDKIIVDSQINYKNLEKNYRDILSQAAPDTKGILEKAFQKKKMQVVAFDAGIYDDVRIVINKIANLEGVSPKSPSTEPTASPAVGASRATPVNDPGDVEGFMVANISENLEYKHDYSGAVQDAIARGQVRIVNGGREQAIFDIDFELETKGGVDLDESKIHLNQLLPGDEWIKDYSFSLPDDDLPPLKIIETIDTSPDEEEISQVFLLDEGSEGKPASVTISIENTGADGAGVTDIVLTKKIPVEFDNLRVESSGPGDAQVRGQELEWVIRGIAPGDVATLELTVTVVPNEIKTFSSGKIIVNYLLGDQTRVTMDPSKISLLGTYRFASERDERDEEPDVWDCQFEFENRSEYPMRVDKLAVDMEIGDDEDDLRIETHELDVGMVIEPGQKWNSEPWEVQSIVEPRFSDHVFLYSIDLQVDRKVQVQSEVLPIDLIVFALEGKKYFDVAAIPSFKESTMHAFIDVTTLGSAPVDVIRVEDTIPGDFRPPDPEDVKLLISGEEVDPGILNVTFEPDSDDVKVEKKMVIEVNHLNEKFGNFADGTLIQVKYPLIAVNPSNSVKYSAPAEFQAFPIPVGQPVVTRMAPEQEIEVVHHRRRSRIGKAIAPAAGTRNYEVVLLFKNKGDVIKTAVKINDFIPAGFSLLESTPEAQTVQKDEGNLLSWIIDEIPPGEEIEITYRVHGDDESCTMKNLETKAFT